MGIIEDKVESAKKWWQSKTIIGTLIAIIPTIVRMIKPEFALDLDGIVNEAWTGVDVIASTADQMWAIALQAFGALLAIYGRIVAKVKIK